MKPITVEVDLTTFKETVATKYITESGLYTGTISYVHIKEVGDNLAEQLTVAINTDTGLVADGSVWFKNKKGETVEMGSSILNSVVLCCNKKKANSKIEKVKGYDGTTEEVISFASLQGKTITLAIQKEFSVYTSNMGEDKIRINNNIIRVFDANGFSATEKINKATEPTAIETMKDLQNKYKDNLTKEIVEDYFANDKVLNMYAGTETGIADADNSLPIMDAELDGDIADIDDDIDGIDEDLGNELGNNSSDSENTSVKDLEGELDDLPEPEPKKTKSKPVPRKKPTPKPAQEPTPDFDDDDDDDIFG